MQFCPECDSRLVRNQQDVAGPWICPKCSGQKIQKKIPSYAVNYTGKTKQCSKGCGAEIYWDEAFKSESGKFIPIDSRTDEPHNCDGPSEPIEYLPDEIKKTEDVQEIIKNHIPQDILFDVNKIPKDVVENDKIVAELVRGHIEETLGIIHYERLIAPESEKVPIESLQDMLSDKILNGLKKYGFSGFLPFQEESIRNILRGNNTAISAPTGSGKTEAFVIPILQKILNDPAPGAVALLVYPLNALIDDQISKITHLIEKCGLDRKIRAYSMHGGQNSRYKEMVISEASKMPLIIATNFDFINYHMILQDKKWNELFKNAKIIVMDEAHSYTSFHGSNVYHVLKRMKRYMKKIQFVGASATLDNSKEFFSNMFDVPQRSLAYVKSESRKKLDMHMFFVMPRKFKQRGTMELLSLVAYKNKSTQLVFSNSHNDAEFLASNVEEADRSIRIQVHRGGLDQRDRKIYESEMKAGELDILSCTPTLELGIDIGHVDVVISAFKNEFDSFVQRIGRAGRLGQESYAICVFDPEDAACHYFARHIKEYLSQEHVISISKENPIIVEKHRESVQIERRAAVISDKSQFFDFAASVNLRGVSKEIVIYHESKKIGVRTTPVGYYQLHQKAIYHFNKQNYEVKSLVKSRNGATAYLVRSTERGKKTIPIISTTMALINQDDVIHRNVFRKDKKIALRYGMISLDRTITGYMKGKYNEASEKFATFNGINTPGWRNFHWKSGHSSVGIRLPSKIVDAVDSNHTITDNPTIHTIQHMLVNAAKILTKSEAGDLDSYYEDGMIYLYDNSSDGFNGCSRMIYDKFERVLEIGYLLLNDCDCRGEKKERWGGCPKCTFTTNHCQTKNMELDKDGAKEFFAGLYCKG